MQITAGSHGSVIGPKQRKHHSYNENVDEPAGLIKDEPVEIEREVPAEESEPVGRTEDDGKPESPAFEE